MDPKIGGRKILGKLSLFFAFSERERRPINMDPKDFKLNEERFLSFFPFFIPLIFFVFFLFLFFFAFPFLFFFLFFFFRFVGLLEKLIGETVHLQNSPPELVPKEDLASDHVLKVQ